MTSSNTKEKKSESIEVRLGYSNKLAFMEACVDDGKTASDVIRKFINGYLSIRRYKLWLAKLGNKQFYILTGSVLLIAFAFYNMQMPLETEQAKLFAVIDTNKDGYLTASDARDNTRQALFPFLENVDTNNDGRLSQSEFSQLLLVKIPLNDQDGDGAIHNYGQPRVVSIERAEGIDVEQAIKNELANQFALTN